MAAVDPALAARLFAPLPAARARRDAQGLAWRPYRGHHPVDDTAATPALVAAATAAAEAGAPLWVLGPGEGTALAAALAHTVAEVVVWECDLSLWQALLGWHPLGAALAAGRLRLVVGPDLVGAPAAAHWWAHPALAPYRPWAPALLGGQGPLALVLSGELFVADTAAALRDRGWRTYGWDREALPPAENARVLGTTAPALVLGINTRAGVCEDADEHGVPTVFWEIDPTTDGPARLARPVARAAAYSYRAANLGPLRAAGYGRVAHLPLATAPARFAAAPRDPALGAAVAFVGASMVESGQRCMAEALALLPSGPRVRAGVERALQIQLQDLGRWQLPGLLDQLVPGLRARVAAAHGGTDLAMLLGEQCAALRRLRWLAPLKDLGLVVWGDAGWELLARHGVDWRGPADHFRDLPRIYRSAAIHVDIGRLYQLDIVTMRVFDVLAAGGFVLAEHSPELAALFVPGRELDTWRTPAELREKVRHYLRHPDHRAAIAAAGQRRVQADHSIARRVARIGADLGLPGFLDDTEPRP